VSEKYAFIDAGYAGAPGNDSGDAPSSMQMCQWLGVSRSGYYEWRSRPQSESGKRRELLKIKIMALFEANNEEYGYLWVPKTCATWADALRYAAGAVT
jgi:hypothetical protein